MNNKCSYAFVKDSTFRALCILPVLAAILCAVLVYWQIKQDADLKDIQSKQAVIAQIPLLKAKIDDFNKAQKTQNMREIEAIKTEEQRQAEQKARPAPVINLTLNGIIFNSTQPKAVINNTFVAVGDEIEDKQVTAIEDHAVTLCDITSVHKCIQLFLDY